MIPYLLIVLLHFFICDNFHYVLCAIDQGKLPQNESQILMRIDMHFDI